MDQTTRWGLPFPELTDAPNIPLHLEALATSLDGVAMDDHGPTVNRPVSTPASPGKAGRYYYDETRGMLQRDIGVGWVDIGPGALPDGVVTEAKLATDSVSQRALAPNSVGAAEILAAAVGTSELIDLAVTYAKLAYWSYAYGVWAASCTDDANFRFFASLPSSYGFLGDLTAESATAGQHIYYNTTGKYLVLFGASYAPLSADNQSGSQFHLYLNDVTWLRTISVPHVSASASGVNIAGGWGAYLGSFSAGTYTRVGGWLATGQGARTVTVYQIAIRIPG